MARIFISYDRDDIDFARHLRTLLQAERFDVWMDERDIEPGVHFWARIQKAIDRSLAFVVVMSPRSEKSEWVQRELARAQQKRKPVLPVLLEGAAWDRLRDLNYAAMTAGLRAELPMLLLKRLKGLRTKRRLAWLGAAPVLAVLVIGLILVGLSFLAAGNDEQPPPAVSRVLFLVDASVAMSEPLPSDPAQTKWQMVWPRLQHGVHRYSNLGYDVGVIVYGPPVSFADQKKIGIPGDPCDDFEWRLGYQGAYALNLQDIGLMENMDLTGAVALEEAVARGIPMGGSPNPVSVILFLGGLINPEDTRGCDLTNANLREILDRLSAQLPEGTDLYLIGVSAEALDLDNLLWDIHVYPIGLAANPGQALDQALNDIEVKINQSVERRKDVATRVPTAPGATQPLTPTPPRLTPTPLPPTPTPPGRDTVAPLSGTELTHTLTADRTDDQPTRTVTRRPDETAPPGPGIVSPSATVHDTASPVPTRTAALPGTVTSSATPTATPSPTVTRTSTASPTGTLSPSPTSTATPAPSATQTGTPSPSATGTVTPLPTVTPTHTRTATPTLTHTPFVIPTSTPPPTSTPVPTATRTRTPTFTPSWTPQTTAAGLITPAPGDYLGPVCGVITSGVGAFVRSGPGPAYTQIGGLAYGTDVSVEAKSQGWSWIYHYSIGNGWVSSGLIAEGKCEDMAATATKAKENPPTRPPSPTNPPTAPVATLPPGLSPTAGPPPTSGPTLTVEPVFILLEFLGAGVYGEGGKPGCTAQVKVIVSGVSSVYGHFCVWNSSYGPDPATDGDCGYGWQHFPRGESTHSIAFGGNQDYRDHSIRIETEGDGKIGPIGTYRCVDPS